MSDKQKYFLYADFRFLAGDPLDEQSDYTYEGKRVHWLWVSRLWVAQSRNWEVLQTLRASILGGYDSRHSRLHKIDKGTIQFSMNGFRHASNGFQRDIPQDIWFIDEVPTLNTIAAMIDHLQLGES